eukprot:Skav206650  [mRNA]  locus=scaffold1933:98509:101869:+ [translate_table: standard]
MGIDWTQWFLRVGCLIYLELTIRGSQFHAVCYGPPVGLDLPPARCFHQGCWRSAVTMPAYLLYAGDDHSDLFAEGSSSIHATCSEWWRLGDVLTRLWLFQGSAYWMARQLPPTDLFPHFGACCDRSRTMAVSNSEWNEGSSAAQRLAFFYSDSPFFHGEWCLGTSVPASTQAALSNALQAASVPGSSPVLTWHPWHPLQIWSQLSTLERLLMLGMVEY